VRYALLERVAQPGRLRQLLVRRGRQRVFERYFDQPLVGGAVELTGTPSRLQRSEQLGELLGRH
jgi:hypothetical protein